MAGWQGGPYHYNNMILQLYTEVEARTPMLMDYQETSSLWLRLGECQGFQPDYWLPKAQEQSDDLIGGLDGAGGQKYRYIWTGVSYVISYGVSELQSKSGII